MLNSRTLVNLFLVILLATFIILLINKKNQQVEVHHLTSLKPSEITRITIPRKNGTPILLEKQGEWVMKQPYHIKAHAFRVNTLLGISQTSSETIYPVDQLSLSEYGLQPARASIIFNDTEVYFGKTNPVNSKRYLLSDAGMFLVLEKNYPLVSAHASSLIDLKLFEAAKTLTSIETPRFTLSKSAAGRWQSTAENLNADQIQKLIQQWQQAQAYAVHRQTDRKVTGEIKLGFSNEQITLHIAEDDNWLILIRPDLAIEYHLDAAFRKKLLEPDNA